MLSMRKKYLHIFLERRDSLYEIFKKLLEERKLTVYQVSKDTKISQAIFSYWKNGRSVPKLDKLKIIATYLGVPLEELIGRGDQ